jgi:hypothetical protein
VEKRGSSRDLVIERGRDMEGKERYYYINA